MTHCRHLVWASKLANLRLCSLPPTMEAFQENLLHAHLQVAHWHAPLKGVVPGRLIMSINAFTHEMWVSKQLMHQGKFWNLLDVIVHLRGHAMEVTVITWVGTFHTPSFVLLASLVMLATTPAVCEVIMMTQKRNKITKYVIYYKSLLNLSPTTQ